MDKPTLSAFTQICDHFKVTIVVGPVPQDRRGPRQSGCCPVKRVIYVPLNWTIGRRRQGDIHEAVNLAEVLHELCHVVLHPPGESIDVVPEDWILMQVERAIAADLFKPHLAYVIQWQEQSIAPLVAGAYDLLGSIPDYINHATWQRGIDLAQRLGVLTSGPTRLAKPTYNLPKWSRLTVKERASWDVA
jgi:hypothetical protein